MVTILSSLISGTNFIELGLLFIWTFFTSLGIPGALIFMVSSGALASNIYELIPLIIVAAVAAILGDITAYLLARKYLSRLSGYLRKFDFFKDNEPKAKSLLTKHQFSAVFLTRFAITQLCAVTSYVSGFEKLNRKKFVIAVILGEVLYASIYPIIGFLFKETWNDVIGVVNNVFIAIVLFLVVVVLLIRAGIKRRAKRLAGEILEEAEEVIEDVKEKI